MPLDHRPFRLCNLLNTFVWLRRRKDHSTVIPWKFAWQAHLRLFPKKENNSGHQNTCSVSHGMLSSFLGWTFLACVTLQCRGHNMSVVKASNIEGHLLSWQMRRTLCSMQFYQPKKASQNRKTTHPKKSTPHNLWIPQTSLRFNNKYLPTAVDGIVNSNRRNILYGTSNPFFDVFLSNTPPKNIFDNFSKFVLSPFSRNSYPRKLSDFS